MKKLFLAILVLILFNINVYAENVHKTIGDLRIQYSKASGMERLRITEDLVPLLMDNNEIEMADNILDDLAHGKTTSQEFEARWLLLKANVFEKQFDYSNAMNNYYKALDIFTVLDLKSRLAQTYFNIGNNFYAQGEIGNAVENLKLAKDIYKESENRASLAKTYSALGNIYFDKEIFGKSKNYYKQSLDIYVEIENYVEAAHSAEKLGTIELVLEDFDAALSYYNNARDIYHTQSNAKGVAVNTFNEAKVYFEDDSMEEAEEKVIEAYSLALPLKDKLLVANILAFEGEINVRKSNYETATNKLLESGEILSKAGNNPEALTIYKKISDTFFDMSDYKNAYSYLEAFQISKNLVFNEEKSKILFEVSKRFESKFNDREQKEKINLLEVEKKSSMKLNYSFGFALFAMLGGLFLLFKSNKQKKKDNVLLSNKNIEIEKQAKKIKEKQSEVLNAKLELEGLNVKLVKEMGDRESIESNSFQKDKFIANKSNAMRTPLQNVVGAAHLITESLDSSNENYETLMNSVNELVVHINDILDYANIEAGKIVLNDKSFNIKKMVASIESHFSQIYRQKDVDLNFSIDKNIPDVIIGDVNKLKQILHNYFDDVLRHSNEGNVFEFYVKLVQLVDKKITIQFNINFQGNLKSLNNEDSSFVFELEETNSFNVEKIDIARRMVELQGGNVKEEKIEGGKQISFDLFFKTSNDVDKNIDVDFNFDNRKILLIEDNKINQMVVKKMLERKGIHVVTADNGLIGLETYKKDDFDLILLDIQMPVMDGYETAAEIRKLPSSAKSRIPIIALTASAYLTEKDKANLFGMNDHVGKPFSPEELLNKVSLHLKMISV